MQLLYYRTCNQINILFKLRLILTRIHRRSCYRDNGDKSPPWQGKELVYQEPESIVYYLWMWVNFQCVKVLNRENYCLFCPALRSVYATFPAISLCHSLFVQKAICPKCCTYHYQEPEKITLPRNCLNYT